MLDTPFAFGFEMITDTGHSLQNSTTLREVGQNAKKGFDNLVQAFAKNGEEVVQGTGKGTSRTSKSVGNMNEFLASDFGKEIGDKLQKTKKRYDGQTVYKVTENIGDLKKGDQLYLDGSSNIDKLNRASGRRLP